MDPDAVRRADDLTAARSPLAVVIGNDGMPRLATNPRPPSAGPSRVASDEPPPPPPPPPLQPVVPQMNPEERARREEERDMVVSTQHIFFLSHLSPLKQRRPPPPFMSFHASQQVQKSPYEKSTPAQVVEPRNKVFSFSLCGILIHISHSLSCSSVVYWVSSGETCCVSE